MTMTAPHRLGGIWLLEAWQAAEERTVRSPADISTWLEGAPAAPDGWQHAEGLILEVGADHRVREIAQHAVRLDFWDADGVLCPVARPFPGWMVPGPDGADVLVAFDPAADEERGLIRAVPGPDEDETGERGTGDDAALDTLCLDPSDENVLIRCQSVVSDGEHMNRTWLRYRRAETDDDRAVAESALHAALLAETAEAIDPAQFRAEAVDITETIDDDTLGVVLAHCAAAVEDVPGLRGVGGLILVEDRPDSGSRSIGGGLTELPWQNVASADLLQARDMLVSGIEGTTADHAAAEPILDAVLDAALEDIEEDAHGSRWAALTIVCDPAESTIDVRLLGGPAVSAFAALPPSDSAAYPLHILESEEFTDDDDA